MIALILKRGNKNETIYTLIAGTNLYEVGEDLVNIIDEDFSINKPSLYNEEKDQDYFKGFYKYLELKEKYDTKALKEIDLLYNFEYKDNFIFTSALYKTKEDLIKAVNNELGPLDKLDNYTNLVVENLNENELVVLIEDVFVEISK